MLEVEPPSTEMGMGWLDPAPCSRSRNVNARLKQYLHIFCAFSTKYRLFVSFKCC